MQAPRTSIPDEFDEPKVSQWPQSAFLGGNARNTLHTISELESTNKVAGKSKANTINQASRVQKPPVHPELNIGERLYQRGIQHRDFKDQLIQ